jgi:hypothetical protein
MRLGSEGRRDSFWPHPEPKPKWGGAKGGVGEGVSRRRVDSSPMVTLLHVKRPLETPFLAPRHLDPKSPGGKNLPIGCRNPRFGPTICYQMRSELENGPTQT